MQISDDVLNTVVYLCEREPSGETVPRATAFFVSDAAEPSPTVWTVTARHCIETASEPIIVRINRRDGGFEDFKTTKADWYTHDSADVASIALDPAAPFPLQVSAIPLHWFVDADYRFRGRKGPFEAVLNPDGTAVLVGSEVFFLGLFTQHAGRAQNLPIARFGTIARMPREPIAIKVPGGTVEIPGYLAEARSWGGHSGSPAFCMHKGGVVVPLPPGKGLPQFVQNEMTVFSLLGLVSAHFDISQKAQTVGDIQGRIETKLNSGIAVITPAEAIRGLLTREDVMEEAAKLRTKHEA